MRYRIDTADVWATTVGEAGKASRRRRQRIKRYFVIRGDSSEHASAARRTVRASARDAELSVFIAHLYIERQVDRGTACRSRPSRPGH
jgi:hypothetical protein